ncbi:DUF1772 domain-containing protein [Mesorhizobium sp. LHD-90]|uniref:anthrone oxygenase family protein n=1 Tax=Mesorhizobium sp. LHD-90 TaxID=3071414 RepID=UPI0027DFD379|nr:anthrone oxygenase family protein [Mesorhizobium sp. LHD-90]MDQ6433386.1 DUF1772 domain-containing protein [Mesorhizobium sp. LHD-90]
MLDLLQIVSLLLVAVAMALSLAHALELPGKLRLTEGEYLAVQPIYYPGFTIGGTAEPLAVIALIALAFFMPAGAPFWLTLGAAAALAAMQAVFWLATQPVNKVWLQRTKLSKAGESFFRTKDAQGRSDADWRGLRDRWEGSHVARAALATLGFVLLAAAVVLV